MTDEAVQISITISVVKSDRNINLEELEETIQGIAIETKQEALGMGIKELDDRIAERMPDGWQNVGTEERLVTSNVGEQRYKRRIYVGEQKHRRKPVDELLGMEKDGRMSGRVQEMGASLVCLGTYRLVKRDNHSVYDDPKYTIPSGLSAKMIKKHQE